MLKLNLSDTKIYKIEHEGLQVEVKPLNKKEDIDLEKRFTTGRMAMERASRRKGKDKVFFPETDYFALNLERAKKTWMSWNLADEKGKSVVCEPKSIELLFLNYWEEFAKPILDKLDEALAKDRKEEAEVEEEEQKN